MTKKNFVWFVFDHLYKALVRFHIEGKWNSNFLDFCPPFLPLLHPLCYPLLFVFFPFLSLSPLPAALLSPSPFSHPAKHHSSVQPISQLSSISPSPALDSYSDSDSNSVGSPSPLAFVPFPAFHPRSCDRALPARRLGRGYDGLRHYLWCRGGFRMRPV